MCKVIRLYRHGETEWNRLGKLQGWLDSPLTEEGRQLAYAVKWQPDYVVSSDLGRAIETAHIMFEEASFFAEDWRLREICLGDWQGKFITELEQEENYQCYLQTPAQFVSDNQESFLAVAERMQQVIEELKRLPYRRIAVISHGVGIASYMAYKTDGHFKRIWHYLLENGDFVEYEV